MASSAAIPPAGLLAKHLNSSNPADCVGALNVLVRLSSDDRLNYTLGEGGEAVVDGLVKAFDDAIGWTEGNAELLESPARDGYDPRETPWENALFRSGAASAGAGTDTGSTDQPQKESWAEFCTRRLCQRTKATYLPSPTSRITDEERAILRVVILIVRNLSFVAANGRFLVHNLGLMRVLAGSLYFRAFDRAEEDDRGRAGGANNDNLCTHALQALMHLESLLDTTGRKVFSDLLLLNPSYEPRADIALALAGTSSGRTSKAAKAKAEAQAKAAADEAELVRCSVPKVGYGLAPVLGYGGLLIAKNFDHRNESMSAIPDDVVETLTAPHARAALALLPALRYSLDSTENHASVSQTMELMTLMVEENQAVFEKIPDSVLYRLTDLVCVPRAGPESFDYCDPVHNIVSRVTPLKLSNGYDSSIDVDLRDRSVDLLVKLTAIGPDMKRRAGRGRLAPSGRHGINSRLYDGLIAMLTCRTGRHDSAQLAGVLLSNLAVAPENRPGIQYMESRLVNAAGRDASVSNTVLNGILKWLQ